MNHKDTPIQISTVPQKVAESEKIKIMREIEAKTEKMVIHALKTGTLPDWIHRRHKNKNDSDHNGNRKMRESAITEIQNIMHSGADKFKENLCRNEDHVWLV
jgi:hypothetical protein